jgi:CubicO group peptidase (beta-lactamase class C family)
LNLEEAVGRLFTEPEEQIGRTFAVVVSHHGVVVAERYDEPEVGPDTTLISWSIAKSITHAAVGILVGRGLLDPHQPAPVPEWQGPDDPRRHITLEHLLRMVDGLDFVEDYVDDRISDVIHMLFQQGKDDVAGYATARPLAHPPGTFWNYSSGTSNIVAAIAGRAVGGTEQMRRLLEHDLFARIGMHSAIPRFDAAGTFIGSSFVYATARDFARFGTLYLQDGVHDGERVLPAGWTAHARTLTPGSGGEYGAHWWLRPGDRHGTFYASGYEGQRIVVVPPKDLVVVRLGKTPVELADNLWPLIDDIVAAIPDIE